MLFAPSPLPDAPSVTKLKFSLLDMTTTENKVELHIHNSSSHDVFYLGNPPGNVLHDSQEYDQASNEWTSKRKTWNGLKSGTRLLKVNESTKFFIDGRLMNQKEKRRVGLYIRWIPNQKTLTLESKDNADLEEGWIFIPLLVK